MIIFLISLHYKLSLSFNRFKPVELNIQGFVYLVSVKLIIINCIIIASFKGLE